MVPTLSALFTTFATPVRFSGRWAGTCLTSGCRDVGERLVTSGRVRYGRARSDIRHSALLRNSCFPDYDWLSQFNADRRKEQADSVSSEIFEVILDQLEKEWFLLVCHAPLPRGASHQIIHRLDETRA